MILFCCFAPEIMLGGSLYLFVILLFPKIMCPFGSLDVINADSIIKEHLRMRWANAHMVIQASLMSQTLHKLSHSLSRTIPSPTLIFFINQRATLSTFGGFEGPTEVTWGGNFLSFICLNIRSRNVKM
ncbi:hypothetical protein YC2023_063094 [Brassica napus]|uniref:(rape) hypothetical protein n=1 Tax=Brassica napus TaxID=3708 RepID=A0A816LLU3_BRANA|nr:unnamed protein product [Brassica napus]